MSPKSFKNHQSGYTVRILFLPTSDICFQRKKCFFLWRWKRFQSRNRENIHICHFQCNMTTLGDKQDNIVPSCTLIYCQQISTIQKSLEDFHIYQTVLKFHTTLYHLRILTFHPSVRHLLSLCYGPRSSRFTFTLLPKPYLLTNYLNLNKLYLHTCSTYI